MAERVITLHGINEARNEATRTTARLIEFPDGISRHITLPGWQWAVLDRFDSEGSFTSATRIIEIVFETAREDLNCPEESFEQKLRYHMSVCLTEGVRWTSDYIRRGANDG
jgi:hypothetical protein